MSQDCLFTAQPQAPAFSNLLEPASAYGWAVNEKYSCQKERWNKQ
jgi:hypothetical protein